MQTAELHELGIFLLRKTTQRHLFTRASNDRVTRPTLLNPVVTKCIVQLNNYSESVPFWRSRTLGVFVYTECFKIAVSPLRQFVIRNFRLNRARYYFFFFALFEEQEDLHRN